METVNIVFLPGTKNGSPPPPIIFAGQLKVGQGDGYAGSDTQQDEEYNHQNAVQSVMVVAPDR